MSGSNNQTISAYDQHVQEYLDGSPQVVEGELKTWIDDCFESVALSAKILEIGSGTGKDADYLERKGYAVERTDASKGFVDFLQKKGKQAYLLNVLTDEIKNTYDVIFADAVFLHFSQKEIISIFKKIYLSLFSNGKLFFTLKQGDGEELTDRKLGGTRYFRYWQPEQITTELMSAGFKNVDIHIAGDYREGRPGWLFISTEKAES